MSKTNRSLRVSNLSIQYRKPQVRVCEDVDFEIQPGEIVGLLGPNGCGKTSMFWAIMSRLSGRKFGGEISGSVEGPNGATVSFIPQNYRQSFFRWANLANNIRLALPSPIGSWSATGQQVKQVAQDLEVDLNLRLRPNSCSGGMLQQAAIIRAFSRKADILLADEPFAALDIEVVDRIRKAFRKLVREREMAAMVILHNMQDVVEICDRVIVVPNKPYTTAQQSIDSPAKEGRLREMEFIDNENINDDSLRTQAKSLSMIAERVLSQHEKP